MANFSPSQTKTTTFYLSDSVDDLEQYFSGELVRSANQLIADKVEIAMNVLEYSPEDATSLTVNSSGTQLIGEYTPDSSASWKGGAKIIVNGSGLSTDSSDVDFEISDISVLLTSSDTPTDWNNPLFKIDIGLGLVVVNDRAQSLNHSSYVVEAGDMKVSWVGPIIWNSTSNIATMSSSRFEIIYDSDPSAAVVLSTLYIESENFVINGDTEALTGTISKIGITNEAGHYFYSDDLDITIDSTAETDAIFSDTGIDTLHTYATVELPLEWENAVMKGGNNISITANSLNNQIDTNDGSNVVLTMAGDDVINLIADSVWSGDYVAKNVGSDTSSVGTNEMVSISGLNRFSDVIDGGADIDTLNLTSSNDAFFIDDVYSDHHNSLSLSSTVQGVNSTARIVNLEVINAGIGDDIIDLTSTNFVMANSIVINGEAGNDVLWGSNGNDTIDGGEGNDIIFGGVGSDALTGGTGSDIFQFTVTSGSDIISDFDINSDAIHLYYNATDRHTNADLNLTGDILTWNTTNTNSVTIDLSTTLNSSSFNDIDSLITFVEIV